MIPFEPASIGEVELPNRLIRSATFEGRADAHGTPSGSYRALYESLSRQGLGALITGFAYVCADGRAMHPGQAGIDADDKIPAFRRTTEAVHRNGTPIFLQIAHAGRQTLPDAVGGTTHAPSRKRSAYFRHRPSPLTVVQIQRIAEAFALATWRAGAAGFDGVQLHAAHGYLIHQFLQPEINDRADAFGIDPTRGIGSAFLELIVERIRARCGPTYPVLIKISNDIDPRRIQTTSRFLELVRTLNALGLTAIEISCGTMDQPLNIFRGETIPVRSILDFNPRYRTGNPLMRLVWRWWVLPVVRRQVQPFTPTYNLPAARLAKRHTRIPVICVGGIRSGQQIRHTIQVEGIDFVSLCRPLLCEPDFALKLRRNPDYVSCCRNCNRCAVLCDSGRATRCYAGRTGSQGADLCPVKSNTGPAHPPVSTHLECL